MKKGLYRKLARSNIKNSKKIYLPYLLTGICMVMIFYIMSFLAYDPEVGEIPGGNTMQILLQFGIWVVGLFSTLFLFYTNHFIMKRRKKEFGLYNILGMGKRHIAKVMFCETIMVGGLCIGCGLIGGILFSKLAQLLLFRLMGYRVTLTFSVDWVHAGMTAALFLLIFFLILLYSLRQVHTSNPIELLRGSSVGEKQPKANWILAVLGLLLLGAGYYLALSVQDALSAYTFFFIAVLLVILGTYCCFVAGSVALLKLLKKKKNYYYRTNHFVSISGMTYRMKRNGAGLASICILSTMVLVMLSSVTCLYVGAEDAMEERYPRDMIINIDYLDESEISVAQNAVGDVLKQNGAEAKNKLSYRYCVFSGLKQENTIILDREEENKIISLDDLRNIWLIPLEDYNQVMKEQRKLNSGEVYLYASEDTYPCSTIAFGGGDTYTVRGRLDSFLPGADSVGSVPTIFLVVPDEQTMKQLYQTQKSIYGDNASNIEYTCLFDLDCTEEKQVEIKEAIVDRFDKERIESAFGINSMAENRDHFYSMYAGLFFLGILLGITFLLAAVLIMYYKQITEGYEDQSRFEIMQKVGMTDREIKKSINSQILTVFFLPLITAGIHMMFSFPMVEKLLQMFDLYNTNLFLSVMAVSFAVFTVFYIIVYLITSKFYYGIVSNRQQSMR